MTTSTDAHWEYLAGGVRRKLIQGLLCVIKPHNHERGVLQWYVLRPRPYRAQQGGVLAMGFADTSDDCEAALEATVPVLLKRLVEEGPGED